MEYEQSPIETGIRSDGEPEQTTEQWSRQRISKWRISIFRNLLIWTLQSPNRLALLPQLSLIFHELCYTKQRETVVTHRSDQKYCRLCVRHGRDPWHPFEDFSTENNRVLKYCRACTRQIASESYQTHREQKKAYDKQYRENNKEERKKQHQEYQKSHQKELNQYRRERRKKV